MEKGACVDGGVAAMRVSRSRDVRFPRTPSVGDRSTAHFAISGIALAQIALTIPGDRYNGP